jgi:hypothetical protein
MDEPRAEGRGTGAPPGWDEFVRDATDPNGRAGAGGARTVPDLSPLIAIVEALRRAVPHELQEQFNALQRELLLTLRALIDWYLDRLDKPELTPQVEDIPID